MAIFGIFFVVALAVIAWIAYGYFGSRAESLGYEVLESKKDYEIRKIKDHLIAETEISGGFGSAGNQAFNILAGYIFGNNKKKQKIAMTTPVISEESEKIAMTTPVISEAGTRDKKNVSFVMPSKYTMENIPEPLDSRVNIKEIKGKKVAVLKFRGFKNEKVFEQKIEEIKKSLQRDKLQYGKISVARYNPPWTPPMMQRNEVWAELIN